MPWQLDIFDDSRDVALRNDLAQALLDGDPLAAAAAAVLGTSEAPAWLAGQWCWLAEQAVGIGWHSDHAEAHAAALYLRGQAWPLAAETVARIASWRRIPLPLLWMTQARWRGEGADAAWPLLAEALWLAPPRAAAMLPALADRRLDRLVARFEERFDPTAASGAGWAWLPAVALVDQPLLAGPLSPATPASETAPGEAFTVVMALLRLERQGRHHEIVAHRARLRSLSAALFGAYMATRWASAARQTGKLIGSAPRATSGSPALDRCRAQGASPCRRSGPGYSPVSVRLPSDGRNLAAAIERPAR
jgi:hypothetical protein